MVVQRGIAAAHGLELVIKVEDDLYQRHLIGEGDALFVQILDVFLDAAPLLNQADNVADILFRDNDFGIHEGFHDVFYVDGIGEVYGVVDFHLLAAFECDEESDAWRGGDDGDVVFPVHSLFDDLQMQHTQKAATEAISQGGGAFLFIDERGVVELEFGHGFHQVFIVFAVDGEDAAEDHGLGFFKAGQSLFAAAFGQGDGVAHAGISHFFDVGDDVARFAGEEFVSGHKLEAEVSQLFDFIFAVGGEKLDAVALLELAVKDAHQDDHATVHIKVRVKDQGFWGCGFVA